MQFLSNKNAQFIALVSTALVHGSVVVWTIFPFNQTLFTQQTISVSFVAPSSQKKQKEGNFHNEFTPITEKKNALKQQKKSEAPAQQEKEITQNQIEKQTSGPVSKNSLETQSAENETIFDAAYLKNPAPYYPQSAKNRGIQGKVLLEVTVKTDGSALNVRILKSSGSAILDDAALNAVHSWKFVPAKRAGQIVQANVIVPIEFKLI